MKAFSLLFSIFILVLPVFAYGDIPAIPKTPAAIIDVVYTRSFTLAKGYKYNWSKEHLIVKTGTLAVLKVDPDLVYPRNTAEPVLYVGNQTAQRLNYGHKSGHVIAIIPGEVDLSRIPIWFGSPELPERVNAKTIRVQRALAERANIQLLRAKTRPFATDKMQSITQKHLEVADLSVLLREYAADLVLKYSPQEKDLAETWRLPVAKAIPKVRKPPIR